MGSGRFSFRSALAGGLIAAMVMTAMPVVASVGEAIRAGLTTKASERTVLKGNVDSQNLRIVNSGSGEAASFVTESGEAPFKVKRKKKVQKLNADRVDGYSAKELAPRAAWNSTDDAPNGADYTLSTEITAPVPGLLLMSGGIDALSGIDNNLWSCGIEVDDSVVLGSLMWVSHDPADDVNEEEDCTTSGAIAVGAGSYVVDLEIEGSIADTQFFDASVWVLWVPFDGSGDTPTSLTDLTRTSSSAVSRSSNGLR